jgi:hypothetical protein
MVLLELLLLPRKNKRSYKNPRSNHLEHAGKRGLLVVNIIRAPFYLGGIAGILAAVILFLLDATAFLVLGSIFGGVGGLLFIAVLLQTIFGANGGYYRKVKKLRARGQVKKLKQLAYPKRNIKAFLALCALVDLGEAKPSELQKRYPRRRTQFYL